MTPEEIEKLAKWGPQHEVPTGKGPRLCRKARDNPQFAALWERRSKELYALGLVRKQTRRFNCDGQPIFELFWWSLLPPEIILARQRSFEQSKAADCDIAIPSRPGLEYLGYQKAGIHYAAEREGTLIADEMGLGKTIQGIGLINHNPKLHRALVICPAHLKIKWYRELNKWLVRQQSVGIADGRCFPTTDIVIINFQILHKYPKRLEFFWDLVIVDEAHELRNPKAQRTKAVLGYSPTPKERRAGVLSSSGINARYRLMLSGTPMANEPFEMFPLLHWLNPRVFASKWDFAKRYCGWRPGARGSRGGSTNADELKERLRSTVMIRRLKKDVLTELPPKRREVIELPAHKVMEVHAENDAVKRFIDGLAQMKADVEIAKASGNATRYREAVENLRLGLTKMNGEIAVIRRQTAIVKVPLVVEAVKEIIQEGNKVILFAYHREVVQAYFEQFKGAVRVWGGMLPGDKQRACDTFQNNPACPIIVGNMDAMGTGLDLTAANVVVFAEEAWVPLVISQCEDRAHRIGQINSVNVIHFVLEGSVDCRMAYRTIEKQEIFDRILDGSKEELANEPLIPMPDGVTVTLKEIEDESAGIGEAQLGAISRAIQILAVECDGARALDGRGFNIVDAMIGKALAGFLHMTQAQAVLGKRLVRKYAKQLPADLVTLCLGSSVDAPARIEPPRPKLQIEPPRAPAAVPARVEGNQFVLKI